MQVLYKTNLDYEETYNKLYHDPAVASIFQTEKGLICCRIKKTKTTFIISPTGNIQAVFHDLEEKKLARQVLEGGLVPKSGERLSVEPLMQTVAIPYPIPNDFKIFWCDRGDKFVSWKYVKDWLIISFECLVLPVLLYALWLKMKS